jgi:hypothetical protein
VVTSVVEDQGAEVGVLRGVLYGRRVVDLHISGVWHMVLLAPRLVQDCSASAVGAAAIDAAAATANNIGGSVA